MTLSALTGDCTGLTPLGPFPFAFGSYEVNPLCWTTYNAPGIAVLAGGDCFNLAFYTLCCSPDGMGGFVWQLYEEAPVDPNEYTFRPDLSSCDPFVLVFDGFGSGFPADCFCSGTFRATITPA
jgi:hypothetical protein